jgi:hypothetical protein
MKTKLTLTAALLLYIFLLSQGQTLHARENQNSATQTTGMPRTVADFDGDGRTDFSVFRPSNNYWYILHSADNSFRPQPWGASGDIPVAADYDGDRKTDIAVFRAGVWYILKSSNNTLRAETWGLAFGDSPAPADYDGDGFADLAVLRSGPEVSSPIVFHIERSSDNAHQSRQWGTTGTDRAVPADYDGDGLADIAIYSHAGGNWHILQSSNGVIRNEHFGIGNFQERPLRADFDGDGKTDLAVFRPADHVWYIQQSAEGFRAQKFGLETDIPVPGDYDGDGKADIAVWRPSNGVWYVQLSSNNTVIAQPFGMSGDIVIPN